MPLSSEPAPLSEVGDRVRVDTITQADIPIYRRAVEESRERIRPWNPVNPDDLPYHLQRQSDLHRTFLIRALPHVRRGAHDVVGKVNVTGITRGRAFSGVMGYDAYDPYAGQGLFAEGLRLVVEVSLRPSPRGLGLNRVEAAVQPGNVRSAGLLRSIGFRRRGAYPNYLWLGDETGREAWRDHVVYGADRGDWPTDPYPPQDHDRPIVVVTPDGANDGDTVAAARALAVEIGVPVVRADDGTLAERLADAVTGAVVVADQATWEAGGTRAHHIASARDLADPASVTRTALYVRDRAHL
ncbi:GNAT family N-acetyltransferase [Mobilicoccus caccae]|uniref:N-acetyltransferase domain-containing protein n=1 Tax=Mobilicoccus caccae TaxID=1859295 RepID=A0ABQ6IQQ6_9MICO|nr:GNAT family N-acetyltransferase [Mobilicoccus caccae]GMA40227.1 hypothetical protein GCM10025883_22720 [Mobilicoccus caccae]